MMAFLEATIDHTDWRKNWRYAAKKKITERKKTQRRLMLRPRATASSDKLRILFTVSTKPTKRNCNHLANVYVKQHETLF